MKNLLLSLLLWLPGFAFAAPPPLPECIPGVRGYTISHPRMHTAPDYWHVAWFCTDKARTRVGVAGFTCRVGSCDAAAAGKAIAAVTAASAKVTTARTHWTAGVKTNCAAAQPDDPALCAARAAWILREAPAWAKDLRAELGLAP